MQKFDAIRPFYETEVNEALQSVIPHPMMKALMNFTFPEMDDEVWKRPIPFVISNVISFTIPFKEF